MKSELGIIQPAGFPGLPEDWIGETETFPASDRTLQLFQTVYHPREWRGGRALLIVHGLGEHGGRYLHFPHFLKDTVGAVYCLDQRGHGRSEGLRGHCDRFTQFTDDLAMVVSRIHEQLQSRFGSAELYVLGHSFGGLVALRTLFLNPSLPLRAASVSSPLLGIKVKVPLLKRWMGHALSGVWGTLQLGNELDPAHLSHDPEVAKTYLEDRLVHDKVTPRMFSEMLAAIDETVHRNSGFVYPLQMLVSMKDEIVEPQASLKFFRDLKLRDKELKTYPNFFHEPFTELGKEDAFEDLSRWIKAH